MAKDTGESLGDNIERFGEAMDLRKEADYAHRFSEEGAVSVIEDAKIFLRKAKAILRKVKI